MTRYRAAIGLVLMASFLSLTSSVLLAQPSGDQVTGIVQQMTDGTVTLTDGRSFGLPDPVRVTIVMPASAADLEPGLFVAITAQRGVDGALHASIVNAFPEEQRGTGEGQRPMDGENLMTNATIDDARVDAVSGADLTVTFLGESNEVRISDLTRVEIRRLGEVADIVPGANLTTVVTDGVSGNISLR